MLSFSHLNANERASCQRAVETVWIFNIFHQQKVTALPGEVDRGRRACSLIKSNTNKVSLGKCWGPFPVPRHLGLRGWSFPSRGQLGHSARVPVSLAETRVDILLCSFITSTAVNCLQEEAVDRGCCRHSLLIITFHRWGIADGKRAEEKTSMFLPATCVIKTIVGGPPRKN